MKNIQYVLLSTLLPVISFAQNPKDYFGVSPENKSVVYIDNYSESNDGYSTSNSKWEERTVDGQKVYVSKKDEPAEELVDIHVDIAKDLEIEAAIQVFEGSDDGMYGLRWGKPGNAGTMYEFLVNNNGDYTIKLFTDELTGNIAAAGITIDKKGYNILTIRKMEGRFFFFVNRVLIKESDFFPFFGKSYGFMVPQQASMEVDYFRVSYINKSKEESTPKIMLNNHEFSADAGKLTTGEAITFSYELENPTDMEVHNVKFACTFPPGVTVVSGIPDKTLYFQPREKKIVKIKFLVPSDYTLETVPVKFKLSGVEMTNVFGLDIAAKLEPQPKKTVTAPVATEVKIDNPVLYRGGVDQWGSLDIEEEKLKIAFGKYYALIIGIDDYSGEWQHLNNAVNDAKSVEELLKSKYYFHVFRTLYNEQATRKNIIRELEWLMENVTEEDNVFIYYSGHGDYKENLQKGFWVPVDAKTSSTTNYISNGDLTTFLGGIKAKHTLLISDACFSGDIFRGKTMVIPYEESDKYYTQVHNKKSRKAITSGGIEPVMDAGSDGHSVFAYYFLKSLRENGLTYYDASQLYNNLYIPVVNNSEQTPMFRPVRNTGDEGGQFIFFQLK